MTLTFSLIRRHHFGTKSLCDETWGKITRTWIPSRQRWAGPRRSLLCGRGGRRAAPATSGRYAFKYESRTGPHLRAHPLPTRAAGLRAAEVYEEDPLDDLVEDERDAELRRGLDLVSEVPLPEGAQPALVPVDLGGAVQDAVIPRLARPPYHLRSRGHYAFKYQVRNGKVS